MGQGPPPAAPDVGLADGVLVPGLVDLQVNGYFGVEMQAAEPGWLGDRGRAAARDGVHGLPAHVHHGPGGATGHGAWVSLRSSCRRGAWRGARVLGVHLEGPFISPRPARRAQPGLDRAAAPAAVDELLDAGAGLVRLVTLAPEVDGALAAISQLAGAGVLVSVGHSDATGAQVAAAAGPGRGWSRICSTRSPRIKSREPGVVGQALADPRLTSGLIWTPATCRRPTARWRSPPRRAGSAW